MGCTVIGLLLLAAIVAGSWFLSKKREVIVIEQARGGLIVAETYHNAPEGRLFGAPAAFGRLIGLQSPGEIGGPGGRARVAEIAVAAHAANDLIIVNQTRGDIWYTASIYGDESKADRNAEQGPVRIEPGKAAAALGKTHGEYRLGCRQAPDEEESFGIANAGASGFAVLGWITNEPPQSCLAGREKEDK